MIKRTGVLTLLLLGLQLTGLAQYLSENPDPLRLEDEVNEFIRWDQKNSFPDNSVLFTGSSSIRMWETHKSFPDYPVINRGFGGSHISDVQYYYRQVISKYHPAVIVFYAGDNDIAADKPVGQVFENYKELTVRILNDNPDVLFVYVSVKPSSSRWKYWDRMQELNSVIQAYNMQHDQLYYVDLARPLLGSDGKPDDSLFMNDRLHLNEQGYAAWNAVMVPKLKEWYREVVSH